MRFEREYVSREEVIRFYAQYDCRKRHLPVPQDLDKWPWAEPDGLDARLHSNGLKKGVLSAYRIWGLAELGLPDLLECAVVNSIFPGEPQALGPLILSGCLVGWLPDRDTEWWPQISNGGEIGRAQALIIRPAVSNEAPARWYVEDGSGRTLALLQRISRYAEVDRTAWAYVGNQPDPGSDFIRSHPELSSIDSVPPQAG